MLKNMVSAIILKDGMAVKSLADPLPFEGGDAVSLAEYYSNRGADEILIFDQSDSDEEHDLSLTLMRRMARKVDIPMWGLGNIKRVEDVKKILYAGCRKAVLNGSKTSNLEMLEEVSKRFGRDKIAVCLDLRKDAALSAEQTENIRSYACALVLLTDLSFCREHGIGTAAGETEAGGGPQMTADKEAGATRAPQQEWPDLPDLPCTVFFCEGENPGPEEMIAVLKDPRIAGLCDGTLRDPETGIMEKKRICADAGIEVNMYTSTVSWDDLKTGPDGLVPVVVQDYKNEEVLMVAYMNREAFDETVRTGVMTYWSRSRQELWVKGLTSGHFQYLKEMRIDCDNDTILVKVAQVGAACHTGNRSCFYRTVLKKEYADRNPMKIFESVYDVIEDRKAHPKEGSYTNYLFEKGIDKILKKCGEEAAEIIIAAKNPNPEEIKYEIADFLYHVMVLMSERGITWEDVSQELANR